MNASRATLACVLLISGCSSCGPKEESSAGRSGAGGALTPQSAPAAAGATGCGSPGLQRHRLPRGNRTRRRRVEERPPLRVETRLQQLRHKERRKRLEAFLRKAMTASWSPTRTPISDRHHSPWPSPLRPSAVRVRRPGRLVMDRHPAPRPTLRTPTPRTGTTRRR